MQINKELCLIKAKNLINVYRGKNGVVDWSHSEIKPIYLHDDNTEGFISLHDKILHIDITGSNDKVDWKQNFDTRAYKLTAENGKSIVVCHGFAMAAENIIDDILKHLKRLVKENYFNTICMGGHSHGAAVAGIISWLLKNMKTPYGIEIYCIVEGCPYFVKYGSGKKYNNDVPYLLRIRNEGDPVSRVPFIIPGIGKFFNHIPVGIEWQIGMDSILDIFMQAKDHYPEDYYDNLDREKLRRYRQIDEKLHKRKKEK